MYVYIYICMYIYVYIYMQTLCVNHYSYCQRLERNFAAMAVAKLSPCRLMWLELGQSKPFSSH